MLLAVIPPPHYGPLLREQTGPGPAATRPWGWPCTAPVTAVLGYQLPFPDRHSPRGEEVGQGTRCSPPRGLPGAGAAVPARTHSPPRGRQRAPLPAPPLWKSPPRM